MQEGETTAIVNTCKDNLTVLRLWASVRTNEEDSPALGGAIKYLAGPIQGSSSSDPNFAAAPGPLRTVFANFGVGFASLMTE